MGEKFEDLKGQTLRTIVHNGDEELLFITTSGKYYLLFHGQDCCESVRIEDICGDLGDLIGEPVLIAEEVTHKREETPEGVSKKITEWADSFTWTFYKLSTRKGGVTIRWLGKSNGYYSESVDFEELSQERGLLHEIKEGKKKYFVRVT